MIVGLGIDICGIPRLRATLKRRGKRFLDRIYTPAEQAYCRKKLRSDESYAARFAAKEAAMKALGTGWAKKVRWRDCEVIRSPGQAPRMVLHGAAARRAQSLGARRTHLTITHSGDQAVAVVILET